ncbi:MAG: energy transducer TonB [Pseudohongiellaceae bacterium]
MTVLKRFVISLLLASGVTMGLFYFMQALIATGERFSDPVMVVRMVDATMPNIEMDLIVDVERPELLEQVLDEQPDVPDKEISLDDGPSLLIDMHDVNVNTGLEFDSATISSTDGEYLPLVTIAPEYPTRAAQRGIEGWCLVSFTVDGLGNVISDTIVVVDAEPAGIFNRSSIRAASRFKFQPRVVDGEGIEVPGVQYLFRYNLDDED